MKLSKKELTDIWWRLTAMSAKINYCIRNDSYSTIAPELIKGLSETLQTLKKYEINEPVKSIVPGQFYGILTNGGSMSGLWEIAKVTEVSGDTVSYEIPNGPSKVETRTCKPSEVYDAQQCAKESIVNRPEYKGYYERFL